VQSARNKLLSLLLFSTSCLHAYIFFWARIQNQRCGDYKNVSLRYYKAESTARKHSSYNYLSVLVSILFYKKCFKKKRDTIIFFFNGGVIQYSIENVKTHKFSSFCQRSVLSFKDHHQLKYFLHMNTCNNIGVIIPIIKC